MPPPIRVLLVGPSLDILGGQAVQARRLLNGLRGSRTAEPSFLPVNPRLPGVLSYLQRVKYVRTIVTSAVYVGSLLCRLRSAEVVHAFSASYWSFLLAPLPAILLGKLFGCRVVLNYHSGEADDHLRRWRRIVIPLMRLADRIVVPSPYLVEVFSRFDLRAESIGNFVDLVEFPFRSRTRLRPLFLNNRNLEALYNIPCTIRAFARIQRRFPEAELVLVGDGKERGALEALTRRLGLRHVTFAGAVPPESMGKYYDSAEIYLNTSDIDNTPLSIIEAFAAGLPVISTSVGGIPWIVRNEENGLLVAPDDDEGVAVAALRLLSDADLAVRLCARARTEVVARYTWRAVQVEWLRLYRALARAPKATV